MKRRNFLAGAAAIGGAALLGSPGLSAQHQPGRFKYKKPVIDAHVHCYPPELAELIEKEGAANGLTNIHRNNNGEVVATQPGYHPYNNNTITFRHEMTEVDQILKMMGDKYDRDSFLSQSTHQLKKLAYLICAQCSSWFVHQEDFFISDYRFRDLDELQI